jgi:hypothetical protein
MNSTELVIPYGFRGRTTNLELQFQKRSLADRIVGVFLFSQLRVKLISIEGCIRVGLFELREIKKKGRKWGVVTGQVDPHKTLISDRYTCYENVLRNI